MRTTVITDRVQAQRALEALRNGVPNRDAVRALGCMQPEALESFRGQLSGVEASALKLEFTQVPGSLIAGGFGSGKSHTLAYFAHEAIERNFIVSTVVVSKETPLYDTSKLFAAAVREAELPGARGSLLHELAIRLDFKSPAGEAFYDWAVRQQPFGMLRASVALFERSHDLELREQIVNWWSGDKLGVAPVRAGLKEISLQKAFEVKAVKLIDLAPIRFEFAARLARAVGFKGWAIMLDEVELIARYSLLQRARSYASLAKLLALVAGQGIPGTTTVAAITDDFDIEVLQRRGDLEKAPARLQQKGDAASLIAASLAQAGMRRVEEPVKLHLPSDDTLSVSYERLKSLYSTAYGVELDGTLEVSIGTHRAMRSFVRRWINEWDVARLFPDETPDSLEEDVKRDYAEDPDFEQESEPELDHDDESSSE